MTQAKISMYYILIPTLLTIRYQQDVYRTRALLITFYSGDH